VMIRATSTVTADLSVGTELWAIWADIALAQLAVAREARNALTAEAEAGSTSLDLNVELHPAMLTIAAVASSIDGFATVVAAAGVTYQAPASKERGRAEYVWEILRAGFDVGSRTNTWPRPLKDLWILRSDKTSGGLFHPKTIFGAAATHPLGPSVSPARALYRLETAEQSVALMRDIYGTCNARSVRPGLDELVARMNGLTATLARFG
jgi:hypothetical protein